MENLVGGIILLFITVYAIKFGFAFLGTITLIVIRMPLVLIGKNYEDAETESLTSIGVCTFAAFWFLYAILFFGSLVFNYDPIELLKKLGALVLLITVGCFSIYIPIYWISLLFIGTKKAVKIVSKSKNTDK